MKFKNPRFLVSIGLGILISGAMWGLSKAEDDKDPKCPVCKIEEVQKVSKAKPDNDKPHCPVCKISS